MSTSTPLTPRTAFELFTNIIQLTARNPVRYTVNAQDPTSVEEYRVKWYLTHHPVDPDYDAEVDVKLMVDGLCGITIEIDIDHESDGSNRSDDPKLKLIWRLGPGQTEPSKEPSGSPPIQDMVLTILRECQNPPEDEFDDPIHM